MQQTASHALNANTRCSGFTAPTTAACLVSKGDVLTFGNAAAQAAAFVVADGQSPR